MAPPPERGLPAPRSSRCAVGPPRGKMPALRCCGAAAPFSQRSLRKSVAPNRALPHDPFRGEPRREIARVRSGLHLDARRSARLGARRSSRPVECWIECSREPRTSRIPSRRGTLAPHTDALAVTSDRTRRRRGVSLRAKGWSLPRETGTRSLGPPSLPLLVWGQTHSRDRRPLNGHWAAVLGTRHSGRTLSVAVPPPG